jgi:hypothetical protein
VKSVPLSASSTSRSAMSLRGRVLRWLAPTNAAYILFAITFGIRSLSGYNSLMSGYEDYMISIVSSLSLLETVRQS